MQATILSIQIIAVHIAFSDGNIFSFIRIAGANVLDKIFGKTASVIAQKPLWECYVCMASVWTILLTWSFDIELILLVCGINYLVQKTIMNEGEA